MQAPAHNDRFRYTGTTSRKPCLQAHVTKSRQIVKGKKTATELLELQTEQMIELLDLSTANFDKVALLRAGYAAPIPAELVMTNTAMGDLCERLPAEKHAFYKGLHVDGDVGDSGDEFALDGPVMDALAAIEVEAAD